MGTCWPSVRLGCSNNKGPLVGSVSGQIGRVHFCSDGAAWRKIGWVQGVPIAKAGQERVGVDFGAGGCWLGVDIGVDIGVGCLGRIGLEVDCWLGVGIGVGIGVGCLGRIGLEVDCWLGVDIGVDCLGRIGFEVDCWLGVGVGTGYWVGAGFGVGCWFGVGRSETAGGLPLGP